MTSYNYNKTTVNIERLTDEVKNSAIKVVLDYIEFYNEIVTLYFKAELDLNDQDLLDTIVMNHSGAPLDNHNVEYGQMSWSQLKAFYDANSVACYMFYVDIGDYYFIWCEFQEQKFTIPHLLKADASDFETNYKSKCNIPEAKTVRITTNRYNRRFHARYITFKTSDPNSICNQNYLGVNPNDVTYKMWDSNYEETNNPALAETTIIDFEPSWCYEISSGSVWIPSTLDGNNDDFWEVHVVGVPDLTETQGGSICFVQNPHIKWSKGQILGVDSALNPANMRKSSTYHTGKIRFLIHHPAGACSEFQASLIMFKCTNPSSTCAQHSKGVR